MMVDNGTNGRESSKSVAIFKKITTFFSTRVRKHLSSDRSSHSRNSCASDCFEIIDSASTKFQLKLKEAMHINWEKPNLNQQVKHINLTLKH